MIRGIEHVALSVSNLDKSLAFYTEVMGLELIRIIDSGAEMRLGDIVGMPDCSARIAHLQSEKTMLEIFEYTSPKGKKITEDFKQADNGFIHIGFFTTDILSDYRRLKDHDVKFFNEPIEFRPGAWVVYFNGPDGEVCELRQT